MEVSGLGGNRLDKHIGIYNVSVSIVNGRVSGSYSWECTKGSSGEVIDFPTCDDCIDFLVVGCDEVPKHVNYIVIPSIGQKKSKNFSFSIAGIPEPENIWIVLAQRYNEVQAKEAYGRCASAAECDMRGLLSKITAPECTEGNTKCEGYNLYECINSRWQLTEENSTACGYTPLPIPIEKVDPLEEFIMFIDRKRPEIPIKRVEEAVVKSADTILKLTPKFRVFPSILSRV